MPPSVPPGPVPSPAPSWSGPDPVGEVHVAQLDPPADLRQGYRVRGLLHPGGGGQQLRQLRHRRPALLVGGVELHQLLHRGEQHAQEEQEAEQAAQAEVAAADHEPADGQDHHLAQDPERLADGPEDGPGAGGDQVGPVVVVGQSLVVVDVAGPPVVGSHGAHARQALLEVAQQVGDPVPDLVVAAGRRPPVPDRGGHQHRHHGQQDDGAQPQVQAEHDAGDDHHGQPLDRHLHQALLEERGEVLHVTGHAGHDDPRLLPLVVVEREPLQVGEHAEPELFHESLAQAAWSSRPAADPSAMLARITRR